MMSHTMTFSNAFGELRSALSQPECVAEVLWAALEGTYEADAAQHAALVVPYLQSWRGVLPERLRTVFSTEELERVVTLAPLARFALVAREGMDVETLFDARCLRYVSELSLNHDVIHDAQVVRLLTGDLEGLRDLSLISNGLTDAAAIAIAQAPCLRDLRALHLRFNPIGDAGVAALAASPHLGALEVLRLGGSRVGLEGALAIATSEGLGQLRRLNLDCTRVPAEGAHALLTTSKLPRLEHVDVGYCGIGQRQVRALRSQLQASSVSELYV